MNENDKTTSDWLGILMEEVGEVAKSCIESSGLDEKEVVQVCAVALAWLECKERNRIDQRDTGGDDRSE